MVFISLQLVLTLSFMLSYEEALDYINSFVDYSMVRADKYSPPTFELARIMTEAEQTLKHLGEFS